MHPYKLVSAALLALSTLTAMAQGYPTRPVMLIVPTAPSTGTDVTGRFLAERLSKEWNVGVVVENRIGANGIIAADTVAKASPDGYTLLMGLSALYANKSLYKSLPFDPVKDFRVLLGLNDLFLALVVRTDSPFNSVQDLVNYARANPGKVTYGSGGAGSTTHLGPALLASMANVQMLHVPYRGAATALTDTMSGQVDFAFTAIATANPQVNGGRMRALAVSGMRRSKGMPTVPTMNELGFTGFNVLSKTFLAAPAGLPDPIADKITAAVTKIIRSPEYQKFLEAQGFEPDTTTPQAYQHNADEEIKHWADIVRLTGAKVE
jgi:tripartite-type tricarboxylate transporter receptor subunit TctC